MGIINVTLNPNDASSGNTLSNGNLTVVSTTQLGIRATHGKTSGKWYWEVRMDSGDMLGIIGVSNKGFSLTSVTYTSINWRAYYGFTGYKFPENSPYGTAWALGNTIGIALDLDNGTLEFYKNGVSMGISHNNVKELGEVYPTLVGNRSQSKTITFNFGATPFTYPIPNGFSAYAMYPSSKFLISSGSEYCSVAPEITGVSTAVPLMTSNTSSNGRAFAGSINSSGFDAWKAFDRADNSYYLSASGTGGIGHLGYEFDKPIRIGKYTLRSTSTLNETSIMPKNWTFEGSNDGVNWTVLDARADETWATVLTDKEYLIDINKTDNYKLYRINWTANGGNVNYTLINEFKMFEFTPSRLVRIPNLLEQTFINHGMSKGIAIDLTTSKMFEQRFIIQDNSQIGSGKVFKQIIDTSKIPIKKASIT